MPGGSYTVTPTVAGSATSAFADAVTVRTSASDVVVLLPGVPSRSVVAPSGCKYHKYLLLDSWTALPTTVVNVDVTSDVGGVAVIASTSYTPGNVRSVCCESSLLHCWCARLDNENRQINLSIDSRPVRV